MTELAAIDFAHDCDREPWQSQFAHILGMDTCKGLCLPAARLATGAQHSVLRADPVYLKADKDSAKLIPGELLALSDADADELQATLNDFVSADGLTFSRGAASAWYLTGMNGDHLESYPPSFLANRNASSFLPDGDAMAPIRRLMTELQMLLHSHPLNEQREVAGQMPVNSVWFWGGAPLPDAGSSAPDITLFADNEEASDMAHHFGLPCHPLSNLSIEQIHETPTANTVLIDTSLVRAWLSNDSEQLVQSLARINEQWLAPLVGQVRAGQIDEVHLFTEDGLQGNCNEQTISKLASSQSNGWLQSLIRRFKR